MTGLRDPERRGENLVDTIDVGRVKGVEGGVVWRLEVEKHLTEHEETRPTLGQDVWRLGP